MAAFTVTTALVPNAKTNDGFDTYTTVLTGSSTTEFWTTALKGFSGNSYLVGTIAAGASMTHTADKVYLDVSIDGTTWGQAKAGTIIASSTASTRAFVIDATGITAPYYRIRIDTVTAFSNTVTFKYAVKKI